MQLTSDVPAPTATPSTPGIEEMQSAKPATNDEEVTEVFCHSTQDPRVPAHLTRII